MLVLNACCASKRVLRSAAAVLTPSSMQMLPGRVTWQPPLAVGWMWNWPEALVSTVVPWRICTLPTVWNDPHGVIVDRPSSEVDPSKRVPTNRSRLSAERV